jgi:hypothetical protein
MEGHHLPCIIENRRAAGAWQGIGRVLEAVLEEVHHLIRRERDLLGAAGST